MTSVRFFKRGLDDLAVAEPLLADLARREQREHEPRRRLATPAPDRARPRQRDVRLLDLDEQELLEVPRRGDGKAGAPDRDHDLLMRRRQPSTSFTGPRCPSTFAAGSPAHFVGQPPAQPARRGAEGVRLMEQAGRGDRGYRPPRPPPESLRLACRPCRSPAAPPGPARSTRARRCRHRGPRKRAARTGAATPSLASSARRTSTSTRGIAVARSRALRASERLPQPRRHFVAGDRIRQSASARASRGAAPARFPRTRRGNRTRSGGEDQRPRRRPMPCRSVPSAAKAHASLQPTMKLTIFAGT